MELKALAGSHFTNRKRINAMKRSLYFAAALLIVMAAFWFCLPHAIAQSSQTSTRQSDAQQAAAEQQARIDRYNQLVHEQEDRAKRVESLLERQEKLMDNQEKAFARFEKILDTWEQQQKQYQAYLDSLKK
ncbi:MAG TPA: hypothetical protein VN761_00130 [Candidatus Polarisedimenticolia bacterium]|nr:hypothetical protein [Candidatus Polarisedimenticolia bacterium]